MGSNGFILSNDTTPICYIHIFKIKKNRQNILKISVRILQQIFLPVFINFLGTFERGSLSSQTHQIIIIIFTRKKAAFRPLFPRPCGHLVGFAQSVYFLSEDEAQLLFPLLTKVFPLVTQVFLLFTKVFPSKLWLIF